MNLSAEFIDSFKLVRSLNYYNDAGIYGVTTRTYIDRVDITKTNNEISLIIYSLFIKLVTL